MKQEMKYKARRVIAALILVGLFLAFTVSVLVKGIDTEFEDKIKYWKIISQYMVLRDEKKKTLHQYTNTK